MDYLKSRRIVKKQLLTEIIDKDMLDIEYISKTLAKSLKIPIRFLTYYGEQELQEHNNRRK